MGELICHRLPSNSNHLAARLVIVPEVVLLRLALDHLQEETAKLFVVGTLTHRRFDIELQMASQTRPKLSVASESEFVAALTKVQICHRADESDTLPGALKSVIRRRTIGSKLRFWNQGSEFCLNLAPCLTDRQKILFGQNIRCAYGHQLNKPEQQIFIPRESDEVADIFFVPSAHQDRVKFHFFKASRFCCRDPIEGLVKKIAPRNSAISFRIQCIERNVRCSNPSFN